MHMQLVMTARDEDMQVRAENTRLKLALDGRMALSFGCSSSTPTPYDAMQGVHDGWEVSGSDCAAAHCARP